MFCQVVIPYKGHVKDLEYTIKCEFLHLEKKKQTNKVNLLRLFDGNNVLFMLMFGLAQT